PIPAELADLRRPEPADRCPAGLLRPVTANEQLPGRRMASSQVQSEATGGRRRGDARQVGEGSRKTEADGHASSQSIGGHYYVSAGDLPQVSKKHFSVDLSVEFSRFDDLSYRSSGTGRLR